MKLHNNHELFKQAVQVTADQMNMPTIYVEKDYWVTYALKEVFRSSIGTEVIFKGGTALSKCFGVIERFSEDIDLVVRHHDTDTPNKLKTRIKKITKSIANVLPEEELPGITHKVGMIRKTAHQYPQLFTGVFGQVRDVIIVEATWLGNYEPYTTATVSSFIYQMMDRVKQQNLITEYNMEPFPVSVLSITRTVCEKIMSLVRFSYTEDPITDLKMKIRHLYDLNQLLKLKVITDFFDSKEFDQMLNRVAQDDVYSFKNNNYWLKNHPSQALIFANSDTIFPEIMNVYKANFKALVYGDFPEEIELKVTIDKIKHRLQILEYKAPRL